MSSYVGYFTSNIIKLDMKGYYAFNEKPPRRSKIRKRNILWILRAASSSYELSAPPLPPQPVATPAKVSRPLQQK
jgi:hypothetical protein